MHQPTNGRPSKQDELPSAPPPAGSGLGRTGDWVAVAAMVALGLCTLAGFRGRDGFRFEQLSHFRVQYAWCLGLAAVWLAARRRWGAAAAGALLAVVNLASIVPLYLPAGHGGGGGAPPEKTITRAMSLNVYWRSRRFAPTLELIRQERPDLVLLLEFTPVWAEAIRPLWDDYPHRHVQPRTSSEGMALLSKYPISVVPVPGADINRRPFRVELPSGTLTLLCVHPPSPQSARDLEWRNQQLRAMGEWAAAQDGPLVILGDLNTTSWSPYFQDLVEVSGLRDSRQGFGVLGTWPAAPLPLRIPIDHCLVSPQIEVVRRWVGPAVGSDHRPILVDFAIAAPP